MNNYTVIVWYRFIVCGEQENDFEEYTVKAEDEPIAKRKALSIHNKGIPYKTEII